MLLLITWQMLLPTTYTTLVAQNAFKRPEGSAEDLDLSTAAAKSVTPKAWDWSCQAVVVQVKVRHLQGTGPSSC